MKNFIKRKSKHTAENTEEAQYHTPPPSGNNREEQDIAAIIGTALYINEVDKLIETTTTITEMNNIAAIVATALYLQENDEVEAERVTERMEIPEEIAAIIAAALYTYETKIKDDENAIITIQRIMKPYSPWSSKIYGLREQPMRTPWLKKN